MYIDRIQDSDREEAETLYLSSFPENERASLEDVYKRIEMGGAEWLGVYDGGLCGIAYVLYSDDVVYLLYIAIKESCRNQGLGSAAIRVLRERYAPRRMILNVEPPEEECDNREQRVRRIGFYERNGFVRSGMLYCFDGNYVNMSYGSPVTVDFLNRFWDSCRMGVLFDGWYRYEVP